ncbi:unnamed protein product [Acanthoscelides obtectus]|uniref:Pyruvate dehydrogenase E1 component subunit beta n=1 Tax=Acanthoscelides obtectus TaxID=200917 RepID=A0A9P0L178_ACAOB|nr:unnamed protein product [Acanthoscelides obtectus]CAK1677946.1 Pyruvate dehydrogenase E1 component subunit beta, mitochondrial [Acanthoscelides obtectus]
MLKRSAGPGKLTAVRTVQLEDNVLHMIEEDPTTSTRQIANSLNRAYTTSGCKVLAATEYTVSYNNVGKLIHKALAKKIWTDIMKQGGRGLQQVEADYKSAILSISDYCENSPGRMMMIARNYDLFLPVTKSRIQTATKSRHQLSIREFLKPDLQNRKGKPKYKKPGKHITIAAHSKAVETLLETAKQLASKGIECEVINLRSLRPLDMETIVNQVSNELSVIRGIKILAHIMESENFFHLDQPALRITGADVPMPYTKSLEIAELPKSQKSYPRDDATCDAREMFTSVDVSWPRSVLDSSMWRNSQTRSQLINKVSVELLGDDGYGIEPCLMTSFRNPTPGAEINYNKLLKQESVIIERGFGQLKRLFLILQYVCRVKLENVLKIIIAYIVLHNVAKSLGEPDFELVEQDPDEDEGNHENDELPLRQVGQQIRRNLAIIINSFTD